MRAGEKRDLTQASLAKRHVKSHPQTQRVRAAHSEVYSPSGGLVTSAPSSSSEGGEERQEEEEERQEGRAGDKDERKSQDKKEREREVIRITCRERICWRKGGWKLRSTLSRTSLRSPVLPASAARPRVDQASGNSMLASERRPPAHHLCDGWVCLPTIVCGACGGHA